MNWILKVLHKIWHRHELFLLLWVIVIAALVAGCFTDIYIIITDAIHWIRK